MVIIVPLQLVQGDDIVVQRVYRAWCKALKGCNKQVLACHDTRIQQSIFHRIKCHLRVVVLMAEMTEEHVAHTRMVVVRYQLRAHRIALMPLGGQDTLFEIGGIRSVEEHSLVVVGFYHDMVGGAQVCLQLLVRFSAIGGYHKSLPLIINHIADTLRGVVQHRKSIDGHAVELPWLPLLKVLLRGAQFDLYTVIAIDTLMNKGCGVNRQMHLLTQRAHSADMVSMVVRDEYTHNAVEIQAHLAQVFLNGTRRDTAIDENAALLRTKVVAVATATAGKTPEYELVFFHNVQFSARYTVYLFTNEPAKLHILS